MEKTIFDVMSSDEKRVDQFIRACDDMLNTQYILVDAKISAILQSIASSTHLYSLFGTILKDFDYRAVAKSCLFNNETQFRTPQEPKKIAALVFCILLDMDKKNIELHDFLSFFKTADSDANATFELFLKEVIAPFKNSVINLHNKNQQDKQQLMQSENNEKAAQHTLSMFIARIEGDTNLADAVKEHLINLLTTLADAIKNNDVTTARTTYTTLTKRIKDHKPNLLKEFERITPDSI